jgi:hypothetical protein
VQSSCEFGIEPSCSIKHVVASRVVLSSTELVSFLWDVPPCSLSAECKASVIRT